MDEEDIPLVQVGQKVLVRADAFPGRVFDAVVKEVTPKGDPVGRSYRVRLGLPDNLPLRIGMTTEANIVVAERNNALLLPAAVVKDGAVWKVTDGRAVLEASGRITPESAPPIAETGVDLLSAGWLTHSSRVLDIGLDHIG